MDRDRLRAIDELVGERTKGRRYPGCLRKCLAIRLSSEIKFEKVVRHPSSEHFTHSLAHLGANFWLTCPYWNGYAENRLSDRVIRHIAKHREGIPL